MLTALKTVLDRFLQVFTIAQLLALTAVVVLAVIFRKLDASLSWYDEIASIQLAWLTFYGSALAALRRSHLGFSGLVLSLPLAIRKALFVFGEVVVISFFVIMAWAGYYVMEIMAGETLVSLPWITLAFAQSALPIGAVLFILAEVSSIPDAYALMVAGRDRESVEIEEAIETFGGNK